MKIKHRGTILLGGTLLLLLLAGCAGDDAQADAGASSAAAGAADRSVVEEVPPEQPEESAVEWETQPYEDDYFTYEIPATWAKNAEYSSDQPPVAFFTEQAPKTETPSNVIVQVLSLQSRSQDLDYSDPEIQKMDYEFLVSEAGGMPEGIQDKEYMTEKVNGTWIYSLSLTRDAGDGTMVRQTGYFPMGLPYTLVIWATDFQDGCTPTVNEVAKHIGATLSIREN